MVGRSYLDHLIHSRLKGKNKAARSKRSAASILAGVLNDAVGSEWPDKAEMASACQDLQETVQTRYRALFGRTPRESRFLESFLALSWADADFNPNWYVRWRHFKIRRHVFCAIEFEQTLDSLASGSAVELVGAISRVGLIAKYVRGEGKRLHHVTAKELASLGGAARARAYDPLRVLARELATARNFRSRRHAALSIAPDIINAAPFHGLRLSQSQAERTITSWIADMSFAGKQ